MCIVGGVSRDTNWEHERDALRSFNCNTRSIDWSCGDWEFDTWHSTLVDEADRMIDIGLVDQVKKIHDWCNRSDRQTVLLRFHGWKGWFYRHDRTETSRGVVSRGWHRSWCSRRNLLTHYPDCTRMYHTQKDQETDEIHTKTQQGRFGQETQDIDSNFLQHENGPFVNTFWENKTNGCVHFVRNVVVIFSHSCNNHTHTDGDMTQSLRNNAISELRAAETNIGVHWCCGAWFGHTTSWNRCELGHAITTGTVVHRVGRTGRNGASGRSFTFFT